MKQLFKEPLLHFLLLGAALFAVFSAVSGSDERAENEILVSAGKIEHLAALFARTWQRPPTRGELEGLINDHVREEVAYREGKAVGLDRDDTIIRRRIRQKLEFVANDLAAQVEPSEKELRSYLASHIDAFRVDPRLTLRQVYLNPDQRGESVETDARDLLTGLNSDPSLDATALGDRILLEHRYADTGLRDIAGLFGGHRDESVPRPHSRARGRHIRFRDSSLVSCYSDSEHRDSFPASCRTRQRSNRAPRAVPWIPGVSAEPSRRMGCQGTSERAARSIPQHLLSGFDHAP